MSNKPKDRLSGSPVNGPDEPCNVSDNCEECDYDSICHPDELSAEWGGKILRFD